MIQIERGVLIAAPPEAVWRVVSDPWRIPQWLASCDKVEVLEPGDVGTRLRLFSEARDRRPTEIDVEVTAMEPNHLLEWTYVAERLGGQEVRRFSRETRFQIWLEPKGTDTRVRLRSEQHPRSALHALAIRVFASREGRRRLAVSLRRLKMIATTR